MIFQSNRTLYCMTSIKDPKFRIRHNNTEIKILYLSRKEWFFEESY